MASINLSGVLKDPEGNPDVGAIVKFTLLSTTGDTVKSSVSELIVPPDGSYNIDLVYGLVRVDYITNWKERFVAIITVNSDTVATSIPELLNASTPPTKPQLLQFQNILADAVAAKDAAESAAATLDIVNDLTLPYVFDNVADMTASVIDFPVGKTLQVEEKEYIKTIGSTSDQANSPNLTGGGYAKYQPESMPLNNKPLKVKPSVNKFVENSIALAAGEQLKLGNGLNYVGQNVTDLIYRTARNSQGGTDGSRQVTARFAVPITDLVNQVTFTIQIDPAYSTGVTVKGISTDDSEISTLSITYFALTDNGGGSYSFGPWTPSGAKDFYGFEVQLTPVDTTNDATLHDEYFVVQSMTIVQNAVNLLSQTEALSGSTWAQQVLQALPLVFSTQTLPSAAGNDVFITHTQNVSGSSYRYAYASPAGLATNSGTEFAPWDLAEGAKLVSSGALGLLILKQGNYSYAGSNPRDIFTIAHKSQRVLCDSPEGALIDTSFALPFSSMAAVASHYEIAYAETNHYNVVTIGTGAATPKIVLDTLKYNFTEVSTAAEVDTTDWSFYWDNSAKKFLIRFDGTQTDDVHVCESGNLFIGDNIGYFGCANIKMKGVQAAFLDIDVGDFYETYNTGTESGNAAGEIYNIDDINGQQADDYVIKCQADGYNYHGSGRTEIYDCIAEHCKDDGISHHDDCTGHIQGGRYDYNGKGGVIPAFGAYVTCVDVSATGNKLGDSPLAQVGNFGGFVCLSSDADTFNTTLLCYDCVADDNKYNFLSSGGKSNLVAYRAVNTSSNTEDFASLTWGSNTLGGRLGVVQSSGGFAFIAGQEALIDFKI